MSLRRAAAVIAGQRSLPRFRRLSRQESDKTHHRERTPGNGDEHRIADALHRSTLMNAISGCNVEWPSKIISAIAGRQLWDEWSRQSDKYNEHDQDRSWKSFKRNGIRIATLFYHAQQAGWRDERIHHSEAVNDRDAGNSKPTKNEDAGPSWDYPDLSLLDDRRGELPPFPLDVFSPTWQEWATNAAHGAGTAVDHVVVPLLGIGSSLIGTARRVRASRSWSEPFTIWTANVGYSGAGKTPGLDVTQRALARIERNRKQLVGELRRAHESKIESAKAANKQWKAKVQEAVDAGRKGPDMPADAEIPEAFVPPRLYVSDSTIEKLAVLLQVRPHGMLYIRDELAGLFLNLSRYSGGTDKEFWLEAWNGKPYNVERVNRTPVDVQHLLVGVTGWFQPDKLVRSFDGDADGLYARFLFAWPTEAPYQPLTDTVEEVEPEFQNAVSRLIDLAEFAEGKLVIRDVGLTPDAVTTFEQFRRLVHQKKDGLDGREREWWVKTPAHVLRLAGTLAYLDWAMELVGTPTPAPTTIGSRFVAAAVRLVTEYFWPHARAAIRQIGLTDSHAKARKVLRWLCAERRDQVSIEDVRRDALQQSLNAEATEKLVGEALVQAGWLRKVPMEKRGPGRHAHRWAVNPLLWTATGISGVTADKVPGERTRPAELRKLRKFRRPTPRSQFPQFPQFPQPALRVPPTMGRRHGRCDSHPSCPRCWSAARSCRQCSQDHQPEGG